VKETETKQSVPAAQAAPIKSASIKAKYKSEDFGGVPIVKLKLKFAGTMQYDSQYHLKLDSTEATELPLTPFFASRIGQTIDLCA
jgi:hypothetical protein